MGMSNVCITILEKDLNQVINYINKSYEDELDKEIKNVNDFKNFLANQECLDQDSIEIEFLSNLIKFQAIDMKWGNWECLEGHLNDLELEYDKEWTDSIDYPAGRSYFRNKAGKIIEISIEDPEDEFLDFLKNNKDLDPEEIKKNLLLEYNKKIPLEIKDLSFLDKQYHNKQNFIKEIKK